MWILVGVALGLVLIAVLVAFRRARGTLYVFNDHGYSAFSTRRATHIHHASKEGLENAIRLLLPMDRFDTLWISTRDDRYSGVILAVESGTPVLSLNFKTQSEQVKLEAFKEAMASKGFICTEEGDGFNGGIGEKFRITSVEYLFPEAPDQISEAIRFALSNLDPDARNDYFLEGWNVRDILGSQPKVKFVPDSDPLKDHL